MIISPATLNALFTGFETKWWQAYTQTPVFWNQIAMLQPSTTEFQTFAWPARIPTMRQWLGPRVANNMAPYVTTYQNLDYELSESIGRNKIEDDQYDVFATSLLQQMAEGAKKQPDYLLQAAMQAGTTTTIWDNANFFDTAHPVDVRNSALGTQSNNFTTKPLNIDNYASVYTSMENFLGENNKPLGIKPNLLVVPPALRSIAQQILFNDYVAPQTYGGVTQVGSSNNVWKGSAQLLVVPELSNEPTTWYLMDTSKVVKPFVWVMRKAAEFTYLNNPNDQNVYQRNEFDFGVHMRGYMGYALWFLCSRCIA